MVMLFFFLSNLHERNSNIIIVFLSINSYTLMKLYNFFCSTFGDQKNHVTSSVFQIFIVGAPGRHSWLSAQFLISAQMVISGPWC